MSAILILCVSGFDSARAQSVFRMSPPDTTIPSEEEDSLFIPRKLTLNEQTDIVDIVDIYLLKKGDIPRTDTGEIRSSKLRLSGIPAAGYTLQTGFAAVVTGNGAFFTDTDAHTSTLLTSFTYTVRSQIIFPFQATIWTPGNKYCISVDWRYLQFPSYTFGLGQNSTLGDGYMIDYSTIHLHQTVLRQLVNNLFLGIGYNYDYYWNIKELDPPAGKTTDFESYGLSSKEFASGLTFNFLYDSRANSINPEKGTYINAIYRPNLKPLGNDSTWRSLVLDLRQYVNMPKGSRNVLAFWSYEWLTLGGRPPYLMLPNTGSDPYSNTGRGYIQGRFRGLNMAYVEAEYRFAITNNGLFGGVIFANAESFTLRNNADFQIISPGWGAGIRLKLNKYSRTNVALDYGFGTGGSGGVFVNLGEVF